MADHKPMSSAPPPTSGDVVSRATDRFRRQHDELHALGFEIAAKLSPATLAVEAGNVRRLIAQFSGKLTVHASMENDALYPRLLEHTDPTIRACAKALLDEVGSIYAAFAEYSKKWPTVASIEADVRGFGRETREVLRVLALRMMRENGELYPLVDAIDGARFHSPAAEGTTKVG